MNKREPLVSIIIPTYNSQKTIGQCLKSINLQTYEKIEILVVDRGSSDETAKIAKKFKAKVFFLDDERSAAKNYAVRKAHGEYIFFVDSDMALTPKIVEECVKKCVQTSADAIIIPEKYIGQGLWGSIKKVEKTSSASINEIPRFFNKTAFIKAGGFDEKLVCGEDFDLFLRFKKAGCKVRHVHSPILHFENEPSFYNVLAKAYHYGKTIPALINKAPLAVCTKYLNTRSTSILKIGLHFKEFKDLLCFTILEFSEKMAYLTGIFVALLCDLFKKCKLKISKDTLIFSLNFSIILLVAVVIFRNFLFTSEWPGGGDVLGFISRVYIYGRNFRCLYMWRPYSFGFVEGINSMDFFLMSLYWIFKDPASTIKIFMFLSYLTAGLSMYYFSYRYTNKHIAALSAALLYILNQWFFSQFTEAHVQIIFSYSMAPLLFILLDRALASPKINNIILLSLGLSLFITGFHPECIVIYGTFLAIFTVFFIIFPEKKRTIKKRFLNFLKVFLPSIILVFCIAAFFLFPFLLNVRSPYFYPSYEYPIEDAVSCSYRNVIDAFTLRAVEKWGYINVVDVYSGLGLPGFPVYMLLFIIFISAYCLILVRRDRYTFYFTFSMVLSVFIAKGPYPPFEQVFIWAWSNIPHFAVFRAANRWIMMAVFSHSFFLSVLVSYLIDFVKKNPWKVKTVFFKIKFKFKGSLKPNTVMFSVNSLNSVVKLLYKILYFTAVFLLILIFLNGFLSCFFFLSQGLKTYTPPKRYLEPYKWMCSQKDDYKVISVSRGPAEWENPDSTESDFAYSAMYTTLGWGHDLGFESSFIHDKPVLQDGGWNPQPRRFVNYLRFHLVRGGLTKNLLKILGAFAYKYVIIPSYITKTTRDFFLNQKGYKIIYSNHSALILQNDYAEPRIFAVTQKAFVLGGMETFDELYKIKDSLNNTALIFVSTARKEASPLNYSFLNNSKAFILINSNILDLAMLSLEKSELIYAANYGFSSINVTKYWVKMPSWSNLGSLVLGGDVLTTNGKNKIDIPFSVKSDGIYNIWLRIGFAPCRGKLTIYVDGEPLGEIKPEFPTWAKLAWINITSLTLSKGEHYITFENDGTGYNDIDAVAIFHSSEFKSKIEAVEKLLQNFSGRIIYILEAENTFLNFSDITQWNWIKIPYDSYILRFNSLGLNIAPYASARATSSSESYAAQYAIDNNLGTRWASEKSMLPQWLELTWSKPQKIRGVQIFFERAYARDYSIQVWNGTNWVNEVTVFGNDKLEVTHEFKKPVETTKMRIFVTAFSVYDRVSIWEFRVYSTKTTTASTKIIIPRKGLYMLAARIATGSKFGTFTLKINNDSYDIQCNETTEENFKWYTIGPLNLSAGEQTIEIGGRGLIEIDKIMFYSLNDNETRLSPENLFHESNKHVLLNYTKIDPCTYQVNINAQKGCLLVLSETYNPLWKAFVNGNEISSIQTDSFINCFPISETGNFTVTIRFTGQNYADLGLKTSLVSLIVVLFFVLPLRFWRKIFRFLKFK